MQETCRQEERCSSLAVDLVPHGPKAPPGFWKHSSGRTMAPQVRISADSRTLLVDIDVSPGDVLWCEPISVTCSKYDIAGRRNQARNASSTATPYASMDFLALLALCPTVVLDTLLSSPSTSAESPPGSNEAPTGHHPVEAWLEAFDALQRVLTLWSTYLWRQSTQSKTPPPTRIPSKREAERAMQVHWTCELLPPLPRSILQPPNAARDDATGEGGEVPPSSEEGGYNGLELMESFCYPSCHGDGANPRGDVRHYRQLPSVCIAIAAATVRAFNGLLKRFNMPPSFHVPGAALFLEHVHRRRVLLCSAHSVVPIPSNTSSDLQWCVYGMFRFLCYSHMVSLEGASNAACRFVEVGGSDKATPENAERDPIDSMRPCVHIQCVATEHLRRGDAVRVFVPREGLLSLNKDLGPSLCEALSDEMKPSRIQALELAHSVTVGRQHH